MVAPDHWSYPVLRRLDAAGLLPAGGDTGRRTIPHDEIALLLEHAAGMDSTGIAGSYLRKFREEFAPARARLTRSGAYVLGGYEVAREQVLAGVGYDTVWTGARALPDADDGFVFAYSAFSSPHVAGAIGADEDRIRELQLILATSSVGLWVGRRPVGYAGAQGGGVVLDGATLDGGGIFLTRPLRVPVVGPVRLEASLSRIDNVLNLDGREDETEPWFWTARLALEPHRRFRIGINRGMIFGGEGNVPVTFSRIVRNLVGIYTTGEDNSFANQVLSVDLRYRWPNATLPVTVYLDWGADDAAGGWWDVPAVAVGIEASLLPRRDLHFGIERTEFARNEASNSIWYQNAWFRGGWTDGGVVLGHGLGGHGVEWRVFVSGGAFREGISAHGALYRRERGDQNLFAPERAGASTGAMLSVNARLTERLRLVLTGEVEEGDSFTAVRARTGLRVGL